MKSFHDTTWMEQVRHGLRLEPDLLRRLRNAFYKKQQAAAEVLSLLPEPQRTAFKDSVDFHSLELNRRVDSALDGASKLLLRTARGQLLETVLLRISSGRTSLCVSSQIGCAARCAFCATGQMGLAINLSRAEILDQVIQANQLLRPEGRAVRNVVFMGMGEPFHNEEEVFGALEVLSSPRGFNLPAARVMVSTVGIPDALIRCAERFPGVSLALSLHSARQEQRERLIPLAKRYPLGELRAAAERVTKLQQRPLMIEYLLLADWNDTDDDLQALIAYLRGLPVHLNLIPYNPIAEAGSLSGTPVERQRAFAAALTAAGFVVTIRYSLGADIAAACGQLVRRENARTTRGEATTIARQAL